jgi:hypothetical protein
VVAVSQPTSDAPRSGWSTAGLALALLDVALVLVVVPRWLEPESLPGETHLLCVGVPDSEWTAG